MTTTKQDIDATLARLAEAFPQTFVLEKYRPHWPLKVGIAAAIPARCPALEWRVLKMALTAYTGRPSSRARRASTSMATRQTR